MQDPNLPEDKIMNINMQFIDENAEGKSAITSYGKNIADLTVGCHLAVSTLHSIYQEWEHVRNQLIIQFEQLMAVVEASRKKSSNYQELLSNCRQLASLIAIVPDPRAQMASQIGSAVTGLVGTFLTDSKPTGTDADVLDATRLLTKDRKLTDELKMHGLQCSMQFGETIEKIEEFHSILMIEDFREYGMHPDVLEFLNGVKEHDPKHPNFYRKLHQSFQGLFSKSLANAESGEQICEPFFLYGQNAIEIIKHLKWNFVETPGSNVEDELQGIKDLIQNSSGPSDLKTIVSRIQNCVLTLNEELQSVKRCMETIDIFGDW